MEPQTPAKVGRYEVLAELGRGAMGAVYRGIDPKLDRIVAIKMISAAMAGGDDRDEILARFEREARVSAKLQHPNVVGVFDVGAEGDELYLVMELIDGDTLGHRLSSGAYPGVTETLEMIAQAADALAVAHEAGVIHRDVKPGNLMVTKTGQIKVGDFGVAKAIGEKTDLTRTGMMVGSPAYMSPEQVKGMPLDGRSDLFSLGVVLFEMLLHRKPFPADTVTTLVYQILHEDPMKDVPIPDAVSNDLADFLRWTLAKDRESRIPDARTFSTRARSLALGQPLVRLDIVGATTAMPVQAAAGAAGAASIARRGPAAPLVGATVPTKGARSKAGLWIGLAAAVAVAGVLGAFLLRKPAPQEVAAEVATPVAAVQILATERPELPAGGGVSSGLTIAIPEAGLPIDEPPPPESSGDGITAGTTPKRPTVSDKARADAAAATAAAEAAAEREKASAAAAKKPEVAGFSIPNVEITELYESSGAVQFHVRPDAAIVTINGARIGKADDWDGFGGGKTYRFPQPGEYYVELTANGYQTVWVKITIRSDIKEGTARIRTKLVKNQ